MNRDDIAAPKPRSMRKVSLGSVLGQMMEWYDFNLFGLSAALVFPAVFFPDSSPLFGTLASFATLGVGFFARPVGALIFGPLGDRIGRRSVLLITIVLMGAATVLIGLVPSTATIGVAAPILLVLLRLLQGVAVGGEQSSAALMMVEHAPGNRRGFFAGVMCGGEYIGQFLATGLFAALSSILSEEDFLSWGWRVPFVLSALIALVGLYIRRQVDDSHEFIKAKNEGRLVESPVRELFQGHRQKLVIVALLRIFENSMNYIISVFALSYAVRNVGVEEGVATTGLLIGAALAIGMIPAFGALSDRLGRKKVFGFGVAFLVLFAWPFFLMLQTGQSVIVIVAFVAAYLFGISALTGVEYAWVSEMFPTGVRNTGVSIGFQFGAIFGGGIAPFIAAALLAAGGGQLWLILGYIAVLAVGAVTAIRMAPETYSLQNLQGDPTGTGREPADESRI